MKSEPDEPPSQLAFWVLLASWLAIAVAIVILLFQEDSHATPTVSDRTAAVESKIWFQLLRYHEGKIFWMGAWETQQECEKARDWYLYEQTDYVGDAFSCPHVIVLKV